MLDWLRDLALQVWETATLLHATEWVAVFLAVLIVQAAILIRKVGRRPQGLIDEHFAEVTTRLNMVIFELRQIRGAYGGEAQDDVDESGLDGPPEEDSHISIAAQ